VDTGKIGRSGRARPALPWFRSDRRPSLIFEVALIGISYWLYSLVRNGVPTQVGEATDRAIDLYEFEKDIGIGFEKGLNKAVDGIGWLVVPVNYYYATMHFVVTIAVLVWLWRSFPTRYRPLRSVLYATNAVALIGFWALPLAPPRFLPGFVDTIVTHGTWGSWASADVAAYSNQYAAMPSMHAGWALWCGVIIFVLARRRWVQVLGIAYPLVTSFVIVATGNHFVLDIVGGWIALAIGFAAQALIFRRPALPTFWPRRSASQESASEESDEATTQPDAVPGDRSEPVVTTRR
jgi:hypothetical protein